MFKPTLLFVAAIAMTIAATVNADQVSIDFEGYPTGPIANGSNGWQITNPNWDQAVVTNGAISGSHSWHFSQAIASGSYGDQPFSPPLAHTSGESTIPGVGSNYFGASMLFKPLADSVIGEGITVSMDRGDGARGNYMRIESLGGNTWQLYAYDYNSTTQDFDKHVLATNLNAGDVHKLSFDQTFVNGPNNDVWNVYLDNNLLYTGRGWEDYFRDWQSFNNPPLAYDRLLFRSGGDPSVPGAAGILFDNITYTNVAPAAVPEPASLAIWSLAAAGAAAGVWRRRKRTSVA